MRYGDIRWGMDRHVGQLGDGPSDDLQPLPVAALFPCAY